jgi:methionyl-tRNA formyltransferase
MTGVRIVFMGTAELSCDSLGALLRIPEFRVVGVVTQPDQPKGRGLRLQPSPVKEIARNQGLPVLQPASAREEAFLEQLRQLEPDLIAVAAYGQILPRTILDLPRFGCLNVHTSLLPKYRGAAPIQWAILNGDPQTGVTIMKVDAGLDTGGILAQESTPIHPEDTAQTMHDRLGTLGAALLVRTIPPYLAGSLQPRPQPTEGASHAPKIRKSDGQIDWQQPAVAVWNRVRALVPWPAAFTHLSAQPRPHLLKLWRAEPAGSSGPPGRVLRADKTGLEVACGAGSLRILELQREGGRRLTAGEFLAGHPLPAGQQLG